MCVILILQHKLKINSGKISLMNIFRSKIPRFARDDATEKMDKNNFSAILSVTGQWRNGIRSTLKMSSGKPGAGSSPACPTILRFSNISIDEAWDALRSFSEEWAQSHSVLKLRMAGQTKNNFKKESPCGSFFVSPQNH